MRWIRYHVKIVVPFRSSSNESNIIDAVKGMKIHTEKIRPHRKHMSIGQIYTVSLSLIKYGVTLVYIRKNSNPLGKKSNLPTGCDCT